MRCTIFLFSVVTVFSCLQGGVVWGQCEITFLDWSNKGQGWHVSTPGKLLDESEAMLLGATGLLTSLVTDQSTLILFDSPTLITEITFKVKSAQSVKFTTNSSIAAVVQLANPGISEWYSADLSKSGVITRLEIIPDLGSFSSYEISDVFLDRCGGLCCQLDWRSKGYEFTVSNPDKSLAEAESILLGAVPNAGTPFSNLVTDETTTITLFKPKKISSITFIAKFAASIKILAGSTPFTVSPQDVSVSEEFTVSLASAGAISKIEITPVPKGEFKLNDVFLNLCPETCSILTTGDVTISPSTYSAILQPSQKTWIGAPVLFTLNTVSNIKSITIYAKKFVPTVNVIGRNSKGGEIFKVQFPATNRRFKKFEHIFPRLQQGVEKIELSGNYGKVRDIEIQMCEYRK